MPTHSFSKAASTATCSDQLRVARVGYLESGEQDAGKSCFIHTTSSVSWLYQLTCRDAVGIPHQWRPRRSTSGLFVISVLADGARLMTRDFDEGPMLSLLNDLMLCK